MNNCTNHINVEAHSFCKVCKKEYCEECLVEGEEYYYCNSNECQQELLKTLKAKHPNFIKSKDIICLNCEVELELSTQERVEGKVRCPNCDVVIDYSSDSPEILENKNFVKLLSSLNQGDIAIIKSILSDGDVDFYVTGENDHYIRPNLEAAIFYVNENDHEKAAELLKDFDLKIFALSSKN